MRRCSAAALVSTLVVLPSCSVWFFSGEEWVDRSRPVVLVETTGGVECGATTELGILTLGRTAKSGPCRVHYFLGKTPTIEDGELVPTGTDTFVRAEIDLKSMAVRVLDHDPAASDALHAMWTADGITTHSVPVRLARDPGITGDVLHDPGQPLPVGATILRQHPDNGLEFVGLVAGKAEVEGRPQPYYVFAGVDRIREMLAVPELHPRDLSPKYRTDDISVLKPVK